MWRWLRAVFVTDRPYRVAWPTHEPRGPVHFNGKLIRLADWKALRTAQEPVSEAMPHDPSGPPL